ncbi:MAG: hypothetical protein SGPRY_014856 [Prymnesium sp.]
MALAIAQLASLPGTPQLAPLLGCALDLPPPSHERGLPAPLGSVDTLAAPPGQAEAPAEGVLAPGSFAVLATRSGLAWAGVAAASGLRLGSSVSDCEGMKAWDGWFGG